MSQARALTYRQRHANYMKQMWSTKITPRQRRRLKHKLNKALAI